MIQLKAVEKRYDDGFVALKDINLELHSGHINVLIGPSGCGKTTTMKMLNRLINPTSGEIYIKDKEISTMNPVELRRQIGYVIQHIGLFPHMTIAQNVSVVPKLLKWEKGKTKERVDELLEMVGLDPSIYRDRYPSELSGGQQQRIGVIRALAAEPDIILMDEPFSALDPISREQLQNELVDLQKKVKKTIVFVTHDMDEALKIADRIIIMQEGTIVQNDTPEEVLRRPKNDFVRDFIGTNRLHKSDELPPLQELLNEKMVTADMNMGFARAVSVMRRQKVDSLLVVNEEKRLEGYVSIFDVIDNYEEEAMSLADILKRVEHVLTRDQTVEEGLTLMTEHQLSYVPVIGENETLLGVITRGTIVGLMNDMYTRTPEASGVVS